MDPRQFQNELERNHHCPKCNGRGGVSHAVALPSGPPALLVPTAVARYLAVSCALCGFTEFYSLAVLAGAAERPVPLEAEASALPE